MPVTAGYHLSHTEIARDVHETAYGAVDAAYADTRWERVRSAIFTDWHTPNHARDSMVRRLAEPARELRRAIEAVLSLQKETDGAHTVADLISLLRSDDTDTVVRAVKHIYAVSRHDGSVACQEIVDELLRVSRSGDPELERLAAGALSHLSEHPNGRLYLFRSGGLAELIRMLGSHDESVVRYALTTLHRLLQHVDASRPAARQLHATRALVPLLDGSRPPKMLALATDAIHLLIFDDPHERNRFAMDFDGARRLVRLLTSYEEQPKVVYCAVRCVRALTAGQESTVLKHALIEKDALIVLYSNLVRTDDPKIRLAILVCLRNLSDAVSNEQDHSALIIVLLDIIRDSALATAGGCTEDEVIYASGALSNLTCNNVNNKAAVYESNGLLTLVDALRLRPNATDETVTEPALCALRHCTARHQHAAAAQRSLVRCGGWAMLLEQLRTLRPPVAKAALGVARNAALLGENRAALVDSPNDLGSDLVDVSVEILSSAAAELRLDPAATSDDGVSMWELAEAAAGALHQLAAHPTIAEWLVHSKRPLMHDVREVLESDEVAAADEVMQRELLGLLYQLSKTDGGVAQMEAMQMAGPVERAMRSPHPSVVTYAAGVLNNLQVEGVPGHGRDQSGYGNPNWDGRPNGERNGMGGEYQTMGSELGEGYEPELFGYQGHGAHGDNYGLDRIDHSFRMPHNNSDWFDTDL